MDQPATLKNVTDIISSEFNKFSRALREDNEETNTQLLKKFKQDDFNFKRKGNKVQYEFNSKLKERFDTSQNLLERAAKVESGEKQDELIMKTHETLQEGIAAVSAEKTINETRHGETNSNQGISTVDRPTGTGATAGAEIILPTTSANVVEVTSSQAAAGSAGTFRTGQIPVQRRPVPTLHLDRPHTSGQGAIDKGY